MPTVYLEAPGKPQELFTLKWRLRAAGVAIGSTWHDEFPGTPQSQLSAFRAEQMRRCDALVVVCSQGEDFRPELGVLIGMALAWGRKIICVGSRILALETFAAIRWVDNIEQVTGELARFGHSGSLAA